MTASWTSAEVERSIPQPVLADRHQSLEKAGVGASRLLVIGSGIALVILCLTVYLASRPVRDNIYIHFVWQADAWLHGQTSVPIGPEGITYQDVMPILDADGFQTGRGIIPFPPLPAVALLPFVAVFGLATDERTLAMLLAAIDVGIAYWMLGPLPIRHAVRVATAAFLGVGTVLWYAAATGSTWFWAHIVAVAFLLAAVGLALRADPDAAEPASPQRPFLAGPGPFLMEAIRLDWRQLLAGFLFGLAVTARLTIVFGFPFFVLVGGGGNWVRRTVSAGLGAAVPVVALLAYTQASTGHLFNPAYDYLYHLELGYTYLNYHADWSVEDIRYVPQNLVIMLGNLPQFLPATFDGQTAVGAAGQMTCLDGQSRSLLDPRHALAMPDPVGTSLFLSSPAYFLGAAALAPLKRLQIDRATTGALLAVLAIAFANLMHFSQGWVQFGYRFSNDFVPFALILVAAGAARLRALWVVVALVAISVVITAWGVYWGGALGW